MRILLVEDERDLRESLIDRLRVEGFTVTGAASALEFYREMASGAQDIVIVDIGLPDQDGLEIVSWLRGKGGLGVIVLTGRSAVEDRVQGFQRGADLYFVKPVDNQELIAAIGNLASRILSGEVRKAEPKPVHWYFDPAKWTLLSPDDHLVKLAPLEMRFLRCLLERPGRTVSRDVLQQSLGAGQGAVGQGNIDAAVKRLRRKIESQTGEAAPIQAVHGQGFVFTAPVRMERRS